MATTSYPNLQRALDAIAADTAQRVLPLEQLQWPADADKADAQLAKLDAQQLLTFCCGSQDDIEALGDAFPLDYANEILGDCIDEVECHIWQPLSLVDQGRMLADQDAAREGDA